MSKYTIEQRHEIYKEAYEIHLDDIKESIKKNVSLHGMCSNILFAIINKYKPLAKYSKIYNGIYNDFNEFKKLKPKYKSIGEYWWSRKNTNKTRISKYKELIEQTKPKG